MGEKPTSALAIHEYFHKVYSSMLIKIIDRLRERNISADQLQSDCSQFKDQSPWFQFVIESGGIDDLDNFPLQAFVPMWFMPPFSEASYAIQQAGNALKHVDNDRPAMAEDVIGISLFSGVRQDRDPIIEGIRQVGVAIDAEIFAENINDYYSQFVSIDFHSFEATQYLRVPHLQLTSAPLFAKYIREKFEQKESQSFKNVSLVALDKGSLQRVLHTANLLGLNLATQVIVLNKERTGHNVLGESNILWGDPSGKYCIIIDDIIDTSSSIGKTCQALLEAGATGIDVMASHAVLTMPARQNINKALSAGVIKDLITTNTLPFSFRLKKRAKEISVVDTVSDVIQALKMVSIEQILNNPQILDELGFENLKDFIMILKPKEQVWQEFFQEVYSGTQLVVN